MGEVKKTILLLSDDIRSHSGVGTISKEIVEGTQHLFNWIQVAANPGHNNSELVNYSDNIKLIPYNTYGDVFLIRQILKEFKIDAILHITDPHYFAWLYEIEHEIRQQVPILYYHVWDNVPDPFWNKPYYQSCDWIGCISKLTYGVVNRVSGLDKSQIDYVPHGINPDTFRPLYSVNIPSFNHNDYDFILFYNNRNIRRKQTSDVILAYNNFCDKLPKEKSDRCLLVMNTQPVDQNGSDLIAVVSHLCNYKVHFINSNLTQEQLNQVYNVSDCTINIANNEGFGLTTAESLMAGVPVIVNITGGLQDQCGFDVSAEDYIKVKSLHKTKMEYGEWVIPVWSKTITLNGSPSTPFLFEDRCDVDDVADAIKQMYDLGKEERIRRGKKGREFMLNNLSSKIMCNGIVQGIMKTFISYKKKEKYKLYKVI